jgi:hypothetical protein
MISDIYYDKPMGNRAELKCYMGYKQWISVWRGKVGSMSNTGKTIIYSLIMGNGGSRDWGYVPKTINRTSLQ